jgi:RNA methyltransferase, TrmH family
MINNEKISSTSLKNIRKLQLKKHRLAAKKFIVEGKKIIEEALKSSWDVEAILSTEEFLKIESNKPLFNSNRKIPVFRISQKDLDSISDTETAQGIAAVLSVSTNDIMNFSGFAKNNSTLVILDEVTDPGNVGTIIRTCNWFGVDAILLSKNSIDLYNPKVIRSTMGSIFHQTIFYDIDLKTIIPALHNRNYKIITTSIKGKAVSGYKFPNKTAIIFGNEAHGISPIVNNLSDVQLTIPKIGEIESLNVAVSCGIVLAYNSMKSNQ